MWAEEALGAQGALLLPLVIFVLSVVHAILGVGLLLFGTPTLMLLGMGFAETLAVVLPCSMTVNLCQLRRGLPADRADLGRFARATLPMLALGMLVALWSLSTRWTAILVGGALLGVGVLRSSSAATAWLTRVISAHRRGYLSGLGLIHGLSNMGGGLLVVYASAVSRDKEEMRRVVAMGYLMFEVVQVATLAAVGPHHFAASQLHLAGLSFVAYWIGNHVFQGLSQDRFRQIVTALVFSYGVLTVGKAFT